MMPEITTPEHVLAITLVCFATLFVMMSAVVIWAVKYVISRSANAVQKNDFLTELKQIRDDFKLEISKAVTSDRLKIEMLEQAAKMDKQLQDTRHQIRNEVETIVGRLQADVANVRDTCQRIDAVVKLFPTPHPASTATVGA